MIEKNLGHNDQNKKKNTQANGKSVRNNAVEIIKVPTIILNELKKEGRAAQILV